MKTFFQKYGLLLAWIQALVAMSGSLWFSLYKGWPPCDLCWYQRICMYPLVLLLAVAFMRRERVIIFYAIPLAVIGWVIALYHNLLYYSILPEAAAPCKAGVSCTTHFHSWFGFITIPLLSFTAFTIILSVLFLYRKYSK